MNGQETRHEFEGATVEEAIERGLRELGVRKEDVEVEILDRGSRGLWGIGARPARVRLTVRTSASSTVLPPGDDTVGIPSAPGDQVEQFAAEMLQGILQRLGFEARVEAYWGDASGGEKRPLVLNIEGRDLGLLIGRQAETLGALQYLIRAIVNQRVHRWLNIVVDVEHYRQRREESLRRLAVRMAEQVARTGRPVVLEAMPPAERRIIHLALRDHPKVYTVSVGEEPRRKVTIRPKSELENQEQAPVRPRRSRRRRRFR